VSDALASLLSGQVANIAGSLATIGTIAMLGLFMTFFLLLDGDKAGSLLLSGISDWRRERLRRAGGEAIDRAGGYLRGTFATASVAAVAEFVFMIGLGIPAAGPLAVVVFFGGLIPYVGASITTAIVVLIALGSNGTATAAVLLVLIVGMHLIRRTFVAPRVYGGVAAVHPAIVLIALPIGAAIGGILLMMIAVPTVVLVAAILKPVLEVLGDPDTPESSSSEDIPVWLDRIGQWSWRALVAFGIGLLGIGAAATVPLVVGPVVVGLTLAATFVPALKALERRGLTRSRATLAVIVVLWASITVVTVVSVAALATDATSVGGTSSAIPDTGATPEGAIKQIIAAFQNGLIGTIATVIREIVGFSFFLALTALLSFYFLRDGDRAWAWATSRIIPWRRREIQVAGARAVTILGGYMMATGVLAAFNAITGFVIMELLGLPLALPIAVLSFLGGFIPYIGQAITSLLGFLVAFKFGTTQDIIIMGVYTIVMNIAQGSFIAPLVYGRAVSLHPAITLMAIPAGGELAGVLGMFLAVPVVGVFAAVRQNILTALGDEPADPSAAVAIPDPTPGAPPDSVIAPGEL
jgi:predicted PurR-regulated permease PerM